MQQTATSACESELLGLLRAWELWSSGLKLEICRLCWIWCLDVVWWGRVGKCIATFSGFVVIIDIFGKDRIADFVVALNKAIEYFTNASWVLLNNTLELLNTETFSKFYNIFLSGFLFSLFVAFVGSFVYNENYAVDLIILSMGIFIGIGTFLVFLALLPSLLAIPFSLLRLLLSAPAAALFRNSDVGSVVTRTLFFLLFLLGFHFDLLSS